jgi:hypothetical protein
VYGMRDREEYIESEGDSIHIVIAVMNEEGD